MFLICLFVLIFFFLLSFVRHQLCCWILTACVCGVGVIEREGTGKLKAFNLMPSKELCGRHLPPGMLVLD